VVKATKLTESPALIVTSPTGILIAPTGGELVYGESWTNSACEGTPAASSRKSM